MLMKDLACRAGVNGGFYGTDDHPLGLMTISGQEISRTKTSLLLNGFAAVVCENRRCFMSISDQPTPGAKYDLQTGPLLLSEGIVKPLSLISDKPARRMVLATGETDTYLISVFNGEAETAGPNLADLPELVKQIGTINHLNLEKAINLDGGGASALHFPGADLDETKPVGSWWCVK